MPSIYLHEHKDFPDLLRILEQETGVQAALVEKDYWIMHVLYGLKKQGFDFELKGGTSLSKGYGIIDRFSEDIDIHIKPPADLHVEENPSKIKDQHIQSRKDFYDWLANHIKIEGIADIARDPAFDDERYYRSGGIRLHYENKTMPVAGIKEGILLEAGFDTVAPNNLVTISSWAFERALQSGIPNLTDNRAYEITCYHPGYTFVEKLQTIATKFRQEQADGIDRPNYMRQYYDVYCLLARQEVLEFIETSEYHAHKKARFPKQDYEIAVAVNEAFLLTNTELRAKFNQRYIDTSALYYKGQPDFDVVLQRMHDYIDKL